MNIDLGTFITVGKERFSINTKQMEAFSDLLEFNKKQDKILAKYIKRVQKKFQNRTMSDDQNENFGEKQMEIQNGKKTFEFYTENGQTVLKINFEWNWREENPEETITYIK